MRSALHPGESIGSKPGKARPRLNRRRLLFTFPEDAQWSSDRQAVEFGVIIGEHEDVVQVSRRVSNAS
jgi:hypothetical protein